MKRIKLSVAENPLETAVIRWINRKAVDYDDVEAVYCDLQKGGCESGFVSDLIYYADTTKFFLKHKKDINAMLIDSLADSGQSISDMFQDKWDSRDPLALDTQNQNLLAWFGFEEAAHNIMSRLGID